MKSVQKGERENCFSFADWRGYMLIGSRIQSFFHSIMSDPVAFILQIIVILTSLILHECAHAYVALKCGDPTAKYLGRLTMDPRKHLDPIGTVCMIVLGVGWAKPVPVNPRNFKNYRRDDLLVSLAGIAMNLLLSLIGTFFYVLIYKKVRTGGDFVYYLFMFFQYLAYMNIALAVFNLLPIPPLDGYHVINDILLRGRFQLNAQMFQVAQIILIVLCISGALSGVLSTVDSALFGVFRSFFMSIIPG